MAKKAKTQYVLLGLIATGPKTGYEIKQTIERSIGYFWQESYGQIYPTLHSLTNKNFISKKSIQQDGRPDKIVYSITNTGIDYFKSWLSSPLELSSQRNELLLRLFFGPALNIEDSIQLLENHIAKSSELYHTFLNIKNKVNKNCELDIGPIENSTYSMLTLEYGIMSLNMELEWSKMAIKTLLRLNGKSAKKEKTS